MNSSLPEITTILSPNHAQSIGWATNKGSKYKFNFKNIQEKRYNH